MQFLIKKPHFRLIFATALVMISGLVISASYLYFAADSIAKTEAIKTARHTARQAALTIQPYILAEDIISLNFFLNSLTEAQQVNGAAVFNKRSQLIARAGIESGTEQQVILGNQQTPTGTLTLYIGHQSQLQMLTGLLWQVAILSTITLLATLITLWLALKQLAARSSQPEEDSRNTDDLSFEQTFVEQSAADQSTVNQSSDTGSTQSKSFEQTLQQMTAQPPLLNTTDNNTFIKSAPFSTPPNLPVMQTTLTDEILDNSELVELLRPDATLRMPHFIPTPMQQEDDDVPRKNPEADFELEELKEHKQKESQPSPGKPNPLRKYEHTEEQLDLYSLGHQLELTLQPQEAAYLFYIDATTGHADYVEPEEHNHLLQTYEQLIQKVASIYGGTVTIDASGDLQLFFDDQDADDGHGVHALCAAKLFTLLYRAFNQARIKAFKPVLNLHMAIVRGNRNKFSLIKEEALFLTRTTQTNELISHTALTEASQLKSTLLSSADLRREDEDKILILSLTPSYQALLTKQATHLLSKPAKDTSTP
ncbi:hypothetical protein [Neptunomonas antarctica]|uniref:Uncharacterized protein n=1 Tax=Neptunomonas antarctica TaxID=619304 RepID=A0A1N7J7E2_9GAMM|nr:hypothetical protein [Neptunomonas antarctica]SIS45224.1 hypothetical protein SAMN05421760_101716 [Neptunomonas antarctica]